MIVKNYLQQKLNTGSAVIGTFSIVPSTVTAEIIAQSGIDFIIVDCEHGPATFETAQSIVVSCEAAKISPVIRVSGLHENEIAKAYDIGAHCVQVPNIRTKKEAQKAVQFSKYPPVGNRGYSPFTRAGGYCLSNAQKLTMHTNAHTLLAIHVEGEEAINNLDRILAVDGIDIIFVGLFDLSVALGIPGDIENPKIVKSLTRIVKKTLQTKKIAGTIATNTTQLQQCIASGIAYIAYSVDCDIIARSYKKITRNFHKLVNEKNIR